MKHYGNNIVDATCWWQRTTKTHVRAVCLAAIVTLLTCGTALAQKIAPTTTCDTNGIGQATLVSDLPTFAFTTRRTIRQWPSHRYRPGRPEVFLTASSNCWSSRLSTSGSDCRWERIGMAGCNRRAAAATQGR